MTFSIFTKRYLSIGLKVMTAFFLIWAIAGCGAGGKESTTANSSPSLTLSFVDSFGNSVTNMVIGSSYTLKATVTQSSGVAPNVITTFVSGGLGTLNPGAGTALTNSFGVAEVVFVPTTIGAAAATASASVTLITKVAGSSATTTSQVTVNGSINYSVATNTVTLGSISLSSAAIVSAGTTAISLPVLINGAAAASGAASVGFSASCGQISPAVATTNGGGTAGATFNSVNADGTLCQGNTTITANSAGATATSVVAVAAPTSGALVYVGAAPSQIYLTTSGANSQSILTFRALSSGAVQPNLPIKITMTSQPGGVSLGSLSNTSPIIQNTDSNGLVTIIVYAGGTPGPVTVKAEWNNNAAVYTTSNSFTIASGAPQQPRMSLSVDKVNIEGWEVDGSETTFTVSVADANGNAVPVGTVINFVAESGQITSSCTTTINASGFSLCSVKFMSQNPRPSDGRISILAYMEGIKGYTDNNSNNQFDAGDVAVDQGDAYRDDNENGQYDIGEFVIVRGGSVSCAGVSGVVPSRSNTCTGTGSVATTLRAQAVILYASHTTLPSAVSTGPYAGVVAQRFSFRLNGSGAPLLPMPQDSSVTVTSQKNGCTVSDLTPSSIPRVANTPATQLGINLGSLHDVLLTGTAAVAASGATPAVPAVDCSGANLKITVTSLSGFISTNYLTVP
jgi:hypothetical protein